MSAARRRRYILFVDDEEQARVTFSSAFQATDFDIATTARAADAVRLIRDRVPDILFLDGHLSLDDPVDGLQWIPRMLRASGDMPVVMFTKCWDFGGAAAALNAGAYFYTEKPGDWLALMPVVERVFKEKALGGERGRGEAGPRRGEKQRPAEDAQLTQDRKTMFQLLQMLGRTIDAKHPCTYGHSDRVAQYAKLLASDLGLEAQEIETVERAALVHDIGKIGIPDTMLDKDDPLTGAEVEEFRHHTEKGDQILEPVRFLDALRPLVRYHHEWYNGQGYPEGKTGAELPQVVWITGLADALDAMTSDRSYRRALPTDEAVSRLRAGSGVQFAPDVVESCISLIDRGILVPAGLRHGL